MASEMSPEFKETIEKIKVSCEGIERIASTDLSQSGIFEELALKREVAVIRYYLDRQTMLAGNNRVYNPTMPQEAWKLLTTKQMFALGQIIGQVLGHQFKAMLREIDLVYALCPDQREEVNSIIDEFIGVLAQKKVLPPGL